MNLNMMKQRIILMMKKNKVKKSHIKQNLEYILIYIRAY